MSFGAVRPRFHFAVDDDVDATIQRLESHVSRPESRCVSRVLGNHVDITVAKEDRHRWSPCVQLDVRAVGDGRSDVVGLIGPHPNTWTLFAFINITILVAAAFGGMLALSQMMLNQSPWGMWAVAGGVLGLVCMYVLSQMGRRFAAEQTVQLMRLVEDACGVQQSVASTVVPE